MIFTVVWPRLALLEAAMLFPVAIAMTGEILCVLGIDGALMSAGGPAYLAVLTGITAVPYSGMLVIVDRLLVVPKGFALLAGLATLVWAAAGAVLSSGVAAVLGIEASSVHLPLVLIAATLSFLAHLPVLWTGLRDDGYAAMRMGVERRVRAEPGVPVGRYMTVDDPREGDLEESPETRRSGRIFRRLYDDRAWRLPLEASLAVMMVGLTIYGVYHWIYVVPHGALVDREQTGPIAVNSDSIPESPVIDGAAGTARDSRGRFIFDATVNGTSMRMVYNDDIRLVTLRAEDALRLGISFERLDFADKIRTDTGVIEVAGITIGTMSVGSITYRLVPGHVARPGALDISILGHSFLGRLATSRLQDNQISFTGTR